MLQAVCDNQIPFRYVLNDLWFASAENMHFVKLDLKKEFIMGLKCNRKVALSGADKADGRYQWIDQLDRPEGTTLIIYLEGVSFPYSSFAKSSQTKMVLPAYVIWLPVT
ncbi:MAG: hypothetical protein H6657_32250 [Ardenticatenaceae bacterium]|nr:hypothetical protein [Ardenticatenaceae bacterium]